MSYKNVVLPLVASDKDAYNLNDKSFIHALTPSIYYHYFHTLLIPSHDLICPCNPVACPPSPPPTHTHTQNIHIYILKDMWAKTSKVINSCSSKLDGEMSPSPLHFLESTESNNIMQKRLT